MSAGDLVVLMGVRRVSYLVVKLVAEMVEMKVFLQVVD